MNTINLITNTVNTARKLATTMVGVLILGLLTMGCPEPGPTTYTVTLDANGGTAGTITTITVAHGGTVPTNTTGLPTRTNYTLAGWNTQADGSGTAFVFGTTTVTANITIFAQWTINIYTVTFNTDGGSTVANQQIAYGGKVVKPANPTKLGYTFDNWYKDEAKTIVFNFETEMIIAATTIYAKWTLTPINSISLPNTASVNWNETLQLTATFIPTDVLDKGLTWTSSDANIATVNSTGLVTGINYGTATITATSVVDNTKKATLTLTVNSVYKWIPDANFRAALKTQFPNAFPAIKLDSLEISHTDVKDFKGKIDVKSKSISNLSGIEYFYNLSELICYTNQITSLDVSKNTALMLARTLH